MNNSFCKSVQRADIWKTAGQRVLLPCQLFYLLVEFSKEAVFVGTSTLSDGVILGKNSLRLKLHSDGPSCSEDSDHVGISVPKTQDRCKTLLYSYPFVTSDNGPGTLGNFDTGDFYA